MPKPKPLLNERRMAVTEAAFRKFDPSSTGTARLSDLLEAYDVSRHPRVLDGSLSKSQAYEAFANRLKGARTDGLVSWEDFLAYYVKVSQEVDLGRELDHDTFFELLVTCAWRLDDDAKQRLARTNIIPIKSLERPVGLAANTKYDLIWPDPDVPNGVVGYRGVVQPVFGRIELPEQLRGHFAHPDETARVPHRYIPAQAPLTPSLDLIWPEEGCGIVGFKGVIASNVDISVLPVDLQPHVRGGIGRDDTGIYFFKVNAASNPHYKRSSESYGVNTTDRCQEILELKRAIAGGTAGGRVWIGRTGNFTREFPGMYRNSSLNIPGRSSGIPPL